MEMVQEFRLTLMYVPPRQIGKLDIILVKTCRRIGCKWRTAVSVIFIPNYFVIIFSDLCRNTRNKKHANSFLNLHVIKQFCKRTGFLKIA